ncbi:salicylate synthase [Nonomuraea sp. NPDC050153]|uniref:salicylate synthase n=1 Tax=Nonomuraea sp. NPDC050153 TaxID=3364359 RepID=UPI003790A256
MVSWAERRVPVEADALATVAALAAGSPEPYVVYEGQGRLCWAEGELATVTVHGSGARLAVDGERRELRGSPLQAAGQALRSLAGARWRAYGWASFELSHALHGLEPSQERTPLAYLAVPRREIRIEHGTALLRAGDEAELDALHDRLTGAVAAGRAPVAEDRVSVDIRGGDAYRAAVASAVADIAAGGLDKVILSRVVPLAEEIDFPATYVAGRRGNDPARSFLLRLGGWEAAGFSPEVVARIDADGAVTTQPLAGTRALGGDPADDLARRNELYHDAKEVYEHAISVRLAMAELERVCLPSTVRVAEFMSVKERGSVQHLASEVGGRLTDGRSGWDALAELFPAVTASGIPKDAACAVIRRAESGDRGLYGGAVLTVDADGTIDAALVLRSVFRRGGRTWLQAGAGIVAQSHPDRELEETVEKLRSVSRFLVSRARVAAS